MKRTGARARGKTRGTASVSLNIGVMSAVRNSMQGKLHPPSSPRRLSTRVGTYDIVKLPGSRFNTLIGINSHRGIEPHSLDASLSLNSVSFSVRELFGLVASLKGPKNDVTTEYDDSIVESPITPIRSPGSPTIPFVTIFSVGGSCAYFLFLIFSQDISAIPPKSLRLRKETRGSSNFCS
jgi:hypothetical protein